MECPGEIGKFALRCNGKVDCMDFSDECYDEVSLLIFVFLLPANALSGNLWFNFQAGLADC